MPLSICGAKPINWLTTLQITLISSEAMPTNQLLHYPVQLLYLMKKITLHVQMIET